MEPTDLLRACAGILDRIGIDYLVTGSMASVAYGEPRFTNDVDVVIRVSEAQAAALCEAFPSDEYYVSVEAAREAARTHGMFNVIHPSSGLKIDFIVAEADEFNRSRFARRRKLRVIADTTIDFASPEDVIIRKLQYSRAGAPDRHVRDIRGILRVMGDEIDHPYLTGWIHRLGLREEWDRVNDVDSRRG